VVTVHLVVRTLVLLVGKNKDCTNNHYSVEISCKSWASLLFNYCPSILTTINNNLRFIKYID